jgi:phenylacetic acid degradation protein paaN
MENLMSSQFFDRHSELLNQATAAIQKRGYWSAFAEMPSPKAYGEAANSDGKLAFEAHHNKLFDLSQPGGVGHTGQEVSPFGIDLGTTYGKSDLNALFPAINEAAQGWRAAGPEVWVGVALEALTRLNKRSFEIAYSVMHTTGQAFMMAFQAGAPHAQDRALEAVAYAWAEMSGVPKTAYWEKPQGKNEPLKMEKRYRVVPKGIALVIGCSTFPTWNSYPGLFASLATGNAVVVKPHPSAMLPLAITVQVIREVLQDAGYDPNVVTLVAHDADDDTGQTLSLRPEVKVIDFTGSSKNGSWIERNALQAKVYAEKSGVNQIIVDSTDDFKGMVRNIAFSLSLYSGQMCTAPQNIYIPQDGIDAAEGHLSFDEVSSAIGQGIEKLLSDTERAVEVLGAIQSEATLGRIEQARALGDVVVESKTLTHPLFPKASVRTPILLKVNANAEDAFSREHFGPISFVVATRDTAHSIELSKRLAIEHGAMTISVYSTDLEVLRKVEDAAAEAGISLSCNLTGSVFVNQSAAYSDFHGTGANPAANTTLSDPSFVTGRFYVSQTRVHL